MEKIRSETVYEGKIIDVRRTGSATPTVRRPTGRSSRTRERSGSSPTAMESSGSSASLARRLATPHLLEVPAGKLDVEGESRLDCAKRELAEEVGLEADGVVGVEAVLHQPGLC